MERLVSVAFGPSRSKRFGKAVAEAQSGAGECSEVTPGRYRVSFVLADDSAAYTGLARVLERVRHWRASEVYEDEELVSTYHAREMAWCASFQLSTFGECRERFQWGVLPSLRALPALRLRAGAPSRDPGRAGARRARAGGLPRRRGGADPGTGLHARHQPRLSSTLT